MKVLKSIVGRSDNSKIVVQLPEPLQINANKRHALQLYSFIYSNAFANIISKNSYDMKVSPNGSWSLSYNGTALTFPEATFTTPAIGEIKDITDFIAKHINDYIKTTLSLPQDVEVIKFEETNFGRMKIIFSAECTDINFNYQSILSSDYLGKFNDNLTSPETTSPKMPTVAPFNRVNLNCSLVGNSSYVMNENGQMVPSQVIASLNSAGGAFEMFDWAANVPVIYPINLSNSLTGMQFELRDEFNKALSQLPDTTCDFSVWIAILEEI